MEYHNQINQLCRRVAALEEKVNQLLRSPPSSTNTIVLDKELDRVIEKIHTLKSTYAGMQTWSISDLVRLKVLNLRKKELMTLLGVKE